MNDADHADFAREDALRERDEEAATERAQEDYYNPWDRKFLVPRQEAA